jgi:hypothetical protein
MVCIKDNILFYVLLFLFFFVNKKKIIIQRPTGVLFVVEKKKCHSCSYGRLINDS